MPQKKNGSAKRIKKLSRIKERNFWLALILFVIAMLICISILGLIQNDLMRYVIYSKVLVQQEEAKVIFNKYRYEKNVLTIDGKSPFDKTIEFAKTAETDNDVEIIVTDLQHNPIEAYGEFSINLNECISDKFLHEFYYDMYCDLNDARLYSDNGKFGFDRPTILIDALRSYSEQIESHPTTFGFNDEIAQLDLWFCEEINNEIVCVKRYLELNTMDIVLAYGVGVLFQAIMIIPGVLLLINLLDSFFRQRRIKKMLFQDIVSGGRNWIYFELYAGRRITKHINRSKYIAIASVGFNKYDSYCLYRGMTKGEMLVENLERYLINNLLISQSKRLFYGNVKINKNTMVAHKNGADFGIYLCRNTREEIIDALTNAVNEATKALSSERISLKCGVVIMQPTTDKEHVKKRTKASVTEIYNAASTARNSIEDDDSKIIGIYNDELYRQLLWENEVEDSILTALKNEEFKVYLQAKYDPATERVAGAEALIRWEKNGELIQPGRFIPIFEKSGYITQIDDYMLDKVSALQAKWDSENKTCVPISVNVSRANFTNPNLAEHICEIVDRNNTRHELIEIELTESAFFDDKETLVSTTKKLKEYGFEISMDDFGAGYSSLNSLKDLSIDVLKLDAEFFRGDYNKERGQSIVENTITLAKKLNVRIVAEGVELKEQVEFLKKLKCDMIQGYYFARPEKVEQFEERTFN